MSRPIKWLAAGVGAIVVLGCAGGLGYGTYVLRSSRPVLDGSVVLPGLAAPVSVARDAQGVPTLTGSNRLDLARALGFLHAQERYFQMDLLRRAGAGELSGLVGAAALPVDRQRRLHRFRWRAEQALVKLPAGERAFLKAYTDGVNDGLRALHHAPWEYALLRTTPAPWTEADCALVTFAMYFDLQDSDATAQIQAQAARGLLGPVLADFLYPKGSPQDAPLDGSHLPEPPMPAGPAPGAALSPRHAARMPDGLPGSNNFAVSGQLSATGAAIVENDMHLDLGVPNIWYRARLRLPGTLDIVGVTLPGQPFVVVGSNTHVAWAFTDSYIETGDAVIIETLPGDPASYKTPDGPRKFDWVTENICPAHAPCEALRIAETIWGPVTNVDGLNHPVVWHWMAEDENAVRIEGFSALEQAHDVTEALAAAHGAGLPDQNFVVGDSAGHVAWTIMGQVPRRVGLDDQVPHSWADGSVGWRGYLSAQEIPQVVNPPDGRLWSANARVLGGAAYALLGDGFYGGPARARAIHDDLFAKDRFTEADLLAIANETRAGALDGWQAAMLAAIDANKKEPRIEFLRGTVADWGGRAVADSAGYRMVHEFRTGVISRIYNGLAAPLAGPDGEVLVSRQADDPSLRLLGEHPAALVPPPYKSWDDLTHSVLHDLADQVDLHAGGRPDHYVWGARNTTSIRHPLSRVSSALGWLTNPADEPVAGDTLVPRVAVPGFGASERLVVSPGHEDQAIFDMPVGQADNPLTPYYMAGHEAWVRGDATNLLPGATKWRLSLVPGA